MRRILRFLLYFFLSFLLIVGLGVVTLRWWGPGVFERGSARVLRYLGFSEAHVSLEAMGFLQSMLTVERLRYEGARISDAELKLGYDLRGLLRRELEQVTVTNPEVEVDFSHAWPSAEGKPDREETVALHQLPGRFPVKEVKLDDAILTLRGTDWTRTVELDLGLTGREHLAGEAALQGEGIQLDARAAMDWPELSGQASVTAKVENPAEWVEFGRDRGWFSLPEAFTLTAEPFEMEAGAGFANQALRDWHLELFGQGVTGMVESFGASVGQVEFRMKGDTAELDTIDLKVSNGTAGHKDLELVFDGLTASATGAEQVDFRLTGWELSGESALTDFGEVSASGGDVELSLDGPWQAWLPDFNPTGLGLRVKMAKAPLSLFTGQGSASGSSQMEAELSAGETRTLSLSAELFDGLLTAAAGSLESDSLSVSVQGTLSGPLGAVVAVKNGRATWSDGGGLLRGLEGDFELASLQPIASEGWQSLQFASIEQGEFSTGAGRLRLNYAGERDGVAPLRLEITTTALGGNVRIMVDGQVVDSLALSIRVLLDSVNLHEIASLFPQFEGRIKGVASGELALRMDGTQIALLPGGIQLVADTNGRFQYQRQGWLTQDPTLDPEAFVSGRDILEIMKDSRGAQVLTELALRDLKMLEFSLKVEESASGDQSVVADIKGDRTIKGVSVPVVLRVPIRGDVKETINAVFEFNARM